MRRILETILPSQYCTREQSCRRRPTQNLSRRGFEDIKDDSFWMSTRFGRYCSLGMRGA